MTFLPDPWAETAPKPQQQPMWWMRRPWRWIPWKVRRVMIRAQARLLLVLIGMPRARLAVLPDDDPARG